MRTSRHVRGLLLLPVVRALRDLRTRGGAAGLEAVDRSLLDERLAEDGWYPMEAIERLGLHVVAEKAGGDRETVRHWGRETLAALVQWMPELLAGGDANESVVRAGAFVASLFDFPVLELESLSEGNALLRVDYGMRAEAEEMARCQTRGFFEALLQQAGATGFGSELNTSTDGAARLALKWVQARRREGEAVPAALPRLLLVDDEPLVLAALERVLRRWAQVTEAATAPEALVRLSRATFDVVVSDYRLGEGDGLALLRVVAARWPQTARVLHTANSPATIMEALAEGVVHAVAEKPVHPAELRRVINEARARAKAVPGAPAPAPASADELAPRP